MNKTVVLLVLGFLVGAMTENVVMAELHARGPEKPPVEELAEPAKKQALAACERAGGVPVMGFNFVVVCVRRTAVQP